jgi:hypothetical protein
MRTITYVQLWQKFGAWFVNAHPMLWVGVRTIGFVIGLIVWFVVLIVSITVLSLWYDMSFIKYFPLLGTCILLIGILCVHFFSETSGVN